MGKLGSFEALQAIWEGRLAQENGYVQVPTSLFVNKIDINMPELPKLAFYVKRDGKLELLKAADQSYSPLALSLHESIWIQESELKPVKAYAEDRILSQGYTDSPSVKPEQKVDLLRKTALKVVDDLFQAPTAENIQRSTKVVSSFVYLLMKDPKAYLLLSKLSSHDPYTLQHSVGTAVAAIILGKKLGIESEEELNELGIAGLLHDIGKVNVRKELINKDGPLDEIEWEEMRAHAEEGYKIVKDNPSISERTKRAILEHHEDRNGTGYPKGLKADQVDIFSKIVCVCDIFNALTTDRTYSKARSVFEAFQYIRDKLAHKVDDQAFKSLVMIYGGNLG